MNPNVDTCMLIQPSQNSRGGVSDLRNLRLVSRTLDGTAIPFIYQVIHISTHIVDRTPLDRARNRTRRRVWANIRACAKYVYISSGAKRGKASFNWNHVVRLLVKCRQLDTITSVLRLSIYFM